jgi:Flp pilus assembly protein TadG
MASLMIRRRLTCDRGSELIEFTLVTPLLLLVFFGILDFGLLFRRYEVLTNAAREGARIAALPPPGYTENQIKARVTDYLTSSGLETGATVLTWPTPAVTTETVPVGGGMCVTVKGVTYNYTNNFLAFGRIITLIGGGSGFTARTLTLTAKMRYEGPAIACP